MSFVFEPSELKEAKKDFRGVIDGAEFSETPFGIKGAPSIKAQAKLGIRIDTPEYDKPQYEWYVPSDKKLTKWAYLLEALSKTGALRDIEVKGETDEERMKSFAAGLVGMEFRFIEYSALESIVKGKRLEAILPETYYGKKEIKPLEIREEKVEEL